MCCPPLTIPGGNPVTELPGLRPRSPVMVLGPVLVTVEPASTAKFPAVPRLTAAGPAAYDLVPAITISGMSIRWTAFLFIVD